jgi:hypothetical protein
MPTPTGAETIGERLTRKRAELAAARLVIDRAAKNGQSFNINGTAVTEMAIERAEERVRRLESEIRSLEARLAGGAARPGLALTRTRIDS